MTELTEEALGFLRMATADHNTVRVPIITDRKVWIQVGRTLERLAGGGRWDRKAQAYVYQRDPREDLERVTGSRVIPPPCATRDKELSYWATPPALAKELVAGLPLDPGHCVLEPSAGDGALVRAVREQHPQARVTAVEPDPARWTVLSAQFALSDGIVWPATTFEEYAADAAGVRFDAVVMNPPFTLRGRRYAWAEHLVLAWGLLRPGGYLRAIVPSSVGYGRQRHIALARSVIEYAGGSWRAAGDGAFRGSGTGVHALIVEAAKGKGSK
ncbi:MAG: methyltransferase [Candidatus Dormibacteria bacterium]